jgi:hypothetical protein
MAAKKKQIKKKTLPKRVVARWTEFGGAKLPKRPSAALKKVLTGLANFRLQAAANPMVVVTARVVTGEGCARQAEIAGFYDMTLGPGQVCIGAAAVKAILDAAAARLCCDTLQCPKECPCEYTPQAKLALYSCTKGHEEGYLLQDKSVWNCRCQVTE